MTVYNKIVMGGRKMGRTQAQVNKFLTRINELESTNRVLVKALEDYVSLGIGRYTISSRQFNKAQAALETTKQ